MSTPLNLDPHLPRATDLGQLSICEMLEFDHQTNRPLAMIVANKEQVHYLALLHQMQAEGDLWLYRKLRGTTLQFVTHAGKASIKKQLVYADESYQVLIGRDGISTMSAVDEKLFFRLKPRGHDDDQHSPQK